MDNIETNDTMDTVIEETLTMPNDKFDIDKLSLELLLNKNHYSKYLSKNDPKKYDEFSNFKAKLRKYSVNIIDITSQLIENPKKPFSSDIEDAFNDYVKSIFRHLELKRLEKSSYNNNNDNDEDDVLFGDMDNNSVEPREDESIPMMKSFWGKTQVIKKQSDLTNFDMRMFGKAKR